MSVFKSRTMNTGLVGFWPMFLSLGHSLSDMWSMPYLPGAEAGKRREEHMEPSHREVPRPPCSGLICTRETTLMCVAQHPAHPGQGSSLSLPLPAHFPTSTTPAPAQFAAAIADRTRPEEAAGPRGKGLHWQPGSPVWAGEGTRGGHLTELMHGDRVCVLYHRICPMRPTHGALLSPGSQ